MDDCLKLVVNFSRSVAPVRPGSSVYKPLGHHIIYCSTEAQRESIRIRLGQMGAMAYKDEDVRDMLVLKIKAHHSENVIRSVFQVHSVKDEMEAKQTLMSLTFEELGLHQSTGGRSRTSRKESGARVIRFKQDEEAA